MDIDIRHHPRDDGGRYQLLVDGTEAGEIDYDLVEGRRVLTHTGVRDGHEGQGLAGTLARRALDDARADGVQIVAVCPFVASYLDKHPDDQDLVDVELSERLDVGPRS